MPTEPHHHRSTTKTSHKPFKPRFTSKNALKDRAKGKVEGSEVRSRKTRHQEVMSKFDRKNKAKQKRLSKHQDHVQTSSVFAGRDGAPRIVAVVPLCDSVSASAAVRSLNKSLDLDQEVSSEGLSLAHIDRFKQRLQYIIVKKDLVAAMNACRMADYVLFVLSAEHEVDAAGEGIIRCIEGQGVSHVYTAVQDLDQVQPAKRRTQIMISLKSFVSHFLPHQEKVFSLDLPQDCQNMLRSLCTTTPKGVKWREDRSWMVVEDIHLGPLAADATGPTSVREQGEGVTAVLTGVVRGRNLKSDRLIQIGDWGDFRIEQITSTPTEESSRRNDGVAFVHSDPQPLDKPSQDQDGLEELAPEDIVMQDKDGAATSIVASDRRGVLLDDQHYFSEHEEEESISKPRKLPRGTSKYQSAWYLGDVSDSGSDLEDVDEQMADAATEPSMAGDRMDDPYAANQPEKSEVAPSEYPQSEPFHDLSPEDEAEAVALEAYRARRKQASDAEEDLAFPDEIELHPNVQSRERLSRYRGLKSARTSPWITEEDTPYQPQDWSRLLEVHDYRGAKSRVLREALVGGVKSGTRVHVYVRNVPLHLIESHSTTKPLGVFSLLRHEHKRAPIDVSISLDSEYPKPIKSKDELIVQIGPRRLVVNPLFSQGGNTSNDVHKFERYLHPGRTAVASFVGPMIWGPVPVLFFTRRATGEDNGQRSASDDIAIMDTDDAEAPRLISTKLTSTTPTSSLELIAHGTVLPTTASPSRVIAKRIILTGEPYKIHRRLVTVRYMFFNRDDVEWFKALRLFTNRGRQGVIKEALGTHGYFKAEFDTGSGRSAVGKMESIGVALWKRVWPRGARRWTGEVDVISG